MGRVTTWLSRVQLLVLYVIVLHIGRSSSITASRPNTKYTVVTYHDDKKSWNDAQLTCKITGGYLYREDSKEKANVLKTFTQGWFQGLQFFWIGLHSVNAGGSFKWTYGMDSCYEVEDDIHSAWFSSDSSSNYLCGVVASGVWYESQCQLKDKFICERKTGGMCFFNESTGSPLLSLSHKYLEEYSFANDHLTCQDKCLNSAKNNMNCWATNFYNTSSRCTLYFTDDPFFFLQDSNIENNSFPLFLKICYENKLNATISDGLSTSITPDEGCRPDMIKKSSSQKSISTLSSLTRTQGFETTFAHSFTKFSVTPSNYSASQLNYLNTTIQPATMTSDSSISTETAEVILTISMDGIAIKYSTSQSAQSQSADLTFENTLSTNKQPKQSIEVQPAPSTSEQTTSVLQSAAISTHEITTSLLFNQVHHLRQYSFFASTTNIATVTSVTGIVVVGLLCLVVYLLFCREKRSSRSAAAVSQDESQI